MAAPKIAIIGAGPAGLTFARLLQIRSITCTIYEAEPHRHSRNQGGSLDLHPQAGQLALKEAGLLDEFKRLARAEGECMKILDKTGKVLYDESPTGNLRPHELRDRPEIDRTDLRNILLDSLNPGTVKWGLKVDHVEVDDVAHGKHTICFTDGTQETGVDLLVGADGAFSKARKLVTDAEPYYSGITMTSQWKLNADNTNPWLSKFVGVGTCAMFDQDRAVIAQRQSGGAVRIYAGVRKPHDWLKSCGIDWSDGDGARKDLVDKCFSDCGTDVKRAILESDDYLEARHLYMLPVGIRWDSKPRVTLLGDAAHLMTPFAGVGVNVAMTDALSLANALSARRNLGESDAIHDAIKDYEKEMFPRAAMFAQKTLNGLEHHFRATGSYEWAKLFTARDAEQQVSKSLH